MADPIFDMRGARKGEKTKKVGRAHKPTGERNKVKKKKRGKGEEEEEKRLRNDITTLEQSSGVYHPTKCIQYCYRT